MISRCELNCVLLNGRRATLENQCRFQTALFKYCLRYVVYEGNVVGTTKSALFHRKKSHRGTLEDKKKETS